MNSDNTFFPEAAAGDFAEQLAASTPTPGGGAVAARVGLYATSLLRMVVGISLNREPEDATELGAINAQAVELGQRFRQLEANDVAAFNGFIAAVRMPRSTEAEKELRLRARHETARQATDVPLRLLEAVVSTLELVQKLQALSGSAGLSTESDLHAAVAFVGASFQVGELNVEANLPYLEADEVEAVNKQLVDLRAAFRGLQL